MALWRSRVRAPLGPLSISVFAINQGGTAESSSSLNMSGYLDEGDFLFISEGHASNFGVEYK